jgi:hypothetical protein
MTDDVKSASTAGSAAQPKAGSYDMFESLQQARKKARQAQSHRRAIARPEEDRSDEA